MTDYRVKLEVYNGPLDLLLYLIRREEIDIHDIPIAKITGQYVAYMDTLKLIDPDLAGEFLVMAATLMEIKTRMLLPRPEGAEEDQEPFDPRAELVRQLLEYKVFKDAAGDLRAAKEAQSLRFPRRPGELVEADQAKDLEDVQMWDLVEAFNTMMAAIGEDLRQAKVIHDDTPIALHAADILDRLQREGNLSFREIFAGRTKPAELVGLFLALLELILKHSVFIEQDRAFGEIYVFLNPDPAPAENDSQTAPAQRRAADESESGTPDEPGR